LPPPLPSPGSNLAVCCRPCCGFYPVLFCLLLSPKSFPKSEGSRRLIRVDTKRRSIVGVPTCHRIRSTCPS
jgi:hypothetical protein